MVWVEFFSMMIKTLLSSSGIWGKFEKMRLAKKKVAKFAIPTVIAFMTLELSLFLFSHYESQEVINEYEEGYSFELQELNDEIHTIVDDYKEDSIWQSILTGVGFRQQLSLFQ